jgi:glycine/D-amino acid oxidase-like deaminating enzyme/nitrite reductase/ring-hydroxylating ferredoxin subunit
MKTAEVPAYPPLQRDAAADVCIVGAGIAGMSAAYLLAREGQSVIVVDDGAIGGGETGRTTAHLSNALDDRYVTLERMHGGEGARLAAESHTAAIDQIERIVGQEAIDCHFERVDGYLFAGKDDSPSFLEEEMEAARRAGLADVHLVERAPIKTFESGVAIRFPRQAQFHVLEYLSGLARAITRHRGQIFCGTHVTKVEGGAQATVETGGGRRITAGSVVVATNTPINDMFAIHTKQAPYRSYAIGARVGEGVPKALYWDTEDPYHYVRLHEDVLIIGGEDHKTGQDESSAARFDLLIAWANQRFPLLEVIHRWSGQVMEPVDYLAFIGRNPGDSPNVYIATGDSGHGMTHGTIAGILLTDLILGRENSWAGLYEPSRKTLRPRPIFEWVKENVNVAMQYADYLTAGEVASIDEISAGAGALIRRGTAKVAAYRDEQGTVHELSAVCPHLGCIVQWNATEKSWDCPCHGSRFDARGKVVNGPAMTDLEPYVEAKKAR